MRGPQVVKKEGVVLGAGDGGGGVMAAAAAFACIRAIRAPDPYIKPRRPSHSSLVCRGGTSWHFNAPNACAHFGRAPLKPRGAGHEESVKGPLLSPPTPFALDGHHPHPWSATQSVQVFLAPHGIL